MITSCFTSYCRAFGVRIIRKAINDKFKNDLEERLRICDRKISELANQRFKLSEKEGIRTPL